MVSFQLCLAWLRVSTTMCIESALLLSLPPWPWSHLTSSEAFFDHLTFPHCPLSVNFVQSMSPHDMSHAYLFSVICLLSLDSKLLFVSAVQRCISPSLEQCLTLSRFSIKFYGINSSFLFNVWSVDQWLWVKRRIMYSSLYLVGVSSVI